MFPLARQGRGLEGRRNACSEPAYCTIIAVGNQHAPGNDAVAVSIKARHVMGRPKLGNRPHRRAKFSSSKGVNGTLSRAEPPLVERDVIQVIPVHGQKCGLIRGGFNRLLVQLLNNGLSQR